MPEYKRPLDSRINTSYARDTATKTATQIAQEERDERQLAAVSSVPLLLELLKESYPNTLPLGQKSLEEWNYLQGQQDVINSIENIYNKHNKDNQ